MNTHLFRLSSLKLGFILGMLFFTSNTISAQQTPFSKGVNLSNWFQVSNAREVQLNLYNLEDFKEIKSLGCDVVRVPINMWGMTKGAPDHAIDPLFFTFLDSLIYWAEETDMHLIIDNHTFEENVVNGKDNGAFLEKLWPQLAYRYKDAYQNIYYELLNEPKDVTDQKWNQIQQIIVDKIRSVDKKHWMIVSPASWGSFHNLENMPMYEDDKLIYSFHFYDPFLFTHQGASWVDPSMASLSGVPFPYNSLDMPAMPSSFQGSWLQDRYNNYPQEGNVSEVQELIDIAISFKNERQVPIYCGEFGVLDHYAPTADRSYWYGVVSDYLGEHEVGWTIWDYHGGFGMYNKGGSNLFNHDLNVEMLEALGLNIPEQSTFVVRPDSSSLVIFDDFIGKNIFQSNNNGGSLSIYEEEEVKVGQFSIHWQNPKQYNYIGFDFRPIRDLKDLYRHDYRFEMWVKGDRPGAKLDIRFLDTKTEEESDLPWRIRYTLDESSVQWDGNWHLLSIPLKDFVEQGSWYNNTWTNPKGEFDWHAIDRFEIVDEYGNSNTANFYFDEIKIVGHPLNTAFDLIKMDIEIYPNPFSDFIQIESDSDALKQWELISSNGQIISKGSFTNDCLISTNQFGEGVYFLNVRSESGRNWIRKVVK